ncbi:hypothetical protein E1B28_007728 [Marasmius oreades]|uniref:DEK C-terminal domain-containing protein n=1 Tax=Marasmius oreades TaxID=181124 RepID=A0A9P7UVY2_9AGAR|nr:uncharacterized protein E1B28_007728 [Marasmius oreades]KAG7094114.1 hypothetical protein E1B28_007728 [Marasmius oreades]
MSVPPISKLKKMTEEIVMQALEDRTLSSLTPRLIRQKVEEKAGLESGSLDDKKYKGPIGDAIKAAQSKTSKAKKEDVASASEPPEEDDGSAGAISDGPREKLKGKKRKSIEAKSTSRATATAKNQNFKSAEFVPTSDIEADEPPSGDVGDVPSKGEDSETQKPPPKKRRKTKNKGPISSLSPKPESGSSSKRPSSLTVAEDSKAESDISDVVDEPPKPKRQGKVKDKSEKTAKKKKAAPALSKDEATIKRLKGFVNACGVRKVWVKVFKGVEDQPSKQIKILKDILAGLGMTGRLSMEQAKAIKEKRDLALELEDVQNFEKAVVQQVPRGSRRIQEEEHSGSDSEEAEEEITKPVKRKNARQSIMAFLEDQSDSD